jgi:hypothetical protein
MASKININIKLDKAKSSVMTNLAIAMFLVVFGLVASKKLLGLYVYQNRVINTQKSSIANIVNDQKVASNVVVAYKNFVSQQINIIGGTSTGTGSTSGNNAKIILDALPQTYDFPATISSVQALLTVPGIIVNSLTGTDSSTIVAQSAQPVPIPLSFSVSGSYANIQSLLSVLNRSVTPIDILSVDISGTDVYLTASITAQTYYYNPPSGVITSTEAVQ